MLKPKNKRIRSGHAADLKMSTLMDELTAFEDFKETILPALQKAVREGVTADEIYQKFQSHAAARAVSIAMKEVDSSKALAAIKDILDRSGGKAAEKREITHKLERLPDEQLDALLLSKLQADEAEDTDLEDSGLN